MVAVLGREGFEKGGVFLNDILRNIQIGSGLSDVFGCSHALNLKLFPFWPNNILHAHLLMFIPKKQRHPTSQYPQQPSFLFISHHVLSTLLSDPVITVPTS